MEKVTALLGHDYFVSGSGGAWKRNGKKRFFSYSHLIPMEEKLLPPNGVYITLSSFGQEVYPGITNVGYKPTIGENFVGVESYLFDYKLIWQNLQRGVPQIPQKRRKIFFL